MDDGGPASSSHDFSATMSVRNEQSSSTIWVSVWRKRVWFSIALLATFALVGFAVMSGWSLARDRSMDLIPTGNARIGFYGASWFKRWTCSDGHDHWSAPYWLGLLLLAPPTGLIWYGWNRRAVRAAPSQRR